MAKSPSLIALMTLFWLLNQLSGDLSIAFNWATPGSFYENIHLDPDTPA